MGGVSIRDDVSGLVLRDNVIRASMQQGSGCDVVVQVVFWQLEGSDEVWGLAGRGLRCQTGLVSLRIRARLIE